MTYGHETKPRSLAGVISIITPNINKIRPAVSEDIGNIHTYIHTYIYTYIDTVGLTVLQYRPGLVTKSPLVKGYL